MRYTHILLDADDTLLDFGETERRALAQLFAHIGVVATEENIRLYHDINAGWWKRIERGEASFDEMKLGRITDFLAASGLDIDPQEPARMMVEFLGQHCIVFDGAEELLARLAPHCRLYIITNGISSVQHSRLDSSPLRRYVERLFISSEIGSRKPEKAYFDYVLAQLGDVDPSAVLVVGDSLSSDIKGGTNAGLDTCWYAPRGGSPGDLSPTYTAATLAEIGDIILNA